METVRIISLDTAYDRLLRSFANNRRRFYEKLNPETIELAQPTESQANRSELLNLCAKRNESGSPHYRFLTVCSHGSAGVVHDQNAGESEVLFTENDKDEDLEIIARDRAIYLFACSTANSQLPKKLINLGSRCVVGFVDSPKWGGHQGNRFWRSVDRRFLRCFWQESLSDAFHVAQKELVSKAKMEKVTARRQFARDLGRIIVTLESMTIFD